MAEGKLGKLEKGIVWVANGCVSISVSVLVCLGAARRTMVWLVRVGVIRCFPGGASVWTLASASLLALAFFSGSKTSVSQNCPFSRRRTSDALASCQTKKLRMNTEGPPVKGGHKQARRKVRLSKRCLRV